MTDPVFAAGHTYKTQKMESGILAPGATLPEFLK